MHKLRFESSTVQTCPFHHYACPHCVAKQAFVHNERM